MMHAILAAAKRYVDTVLGMYATHHARHEPGGADALTDLDGTITVDTTATQTLTNVPTDDEKDGISGLTGANNAIGATAYNSNAHAALHETGGAAVLTDLPAAATLAAGATTVTQVAAQLPTANEKAGIAGLTAVNTAIGATAYNGAAHAALHETGGAAVLTDLPAAATLAAGATTVANVAAQIPTAAEKAGIAGLTGANTAVGQNAFDAAAHGNMHGQGGLSPIPSVPAAATIGAGPLTAANVLAWVDQDVTNGSDPAFDGTNFADIPHTADLPVDDLAADLTGAGVSHMTTATPKHSRIPIDHATPDANDDIIIYPANSPAMAIDDVWAEVDTVEGGAMTLTLRTAAAGGGAPISSALDFNAGALVRTTALDNNLMPAGSSLYANFSANPGTLVGILHILWHQTA